MDLTIDQIDEIGSHITRNSAQRKVSFQKPQQGLTELAEISSYANSPLRYNLNVIKLEKDQVSTQAVQKASKLL